MKSKLQLWQQIVIIFFGVSAIPILFVAVYAFVDNSKELNKAYTAIWLGTMTPTTEFVDTESNPSGWFTTPVPPKSEQYQILYVNTIPWQGLCGDKIYIIRLHATWPDKVEIEHGFQGETIIEPFFPAQRNYVETICHKFDILVDPNSNWLLKVSER